VNQRITLKNINHFDIQLSSHLIMSLKKGKDKNKPAVTDGLDNLFNKPAEMRKTE